MKSGRTDVAISWLTSDKKVARTIPQTVRLSQRRVVIAGKMMIGYRWCFANGARLYPRAIKVPSMKKSGVQVESWYNHPEWFEIGFQDVTKQEADFFEK